MMKFKEYINEYLDDRTELAVFRTLKDNGFDCDSDIDEVLAFVSNTATKLRSKEVDNVVRDFFTKGNCDRNFLQKLFGKHR